MATYRDIQLRTRGQHGFVAGADIAAVVLAFVEAAGRPAAISAKWVRSKFNADSQAKVKPQPRS